MLPNLNGLTLLRRLRVKVYMLHQRAAMDVLPPGPRHVDLTEGALPLTEYLKDTVARFLPCCQEVIAPRVLNGKRVIIVRHGNSRRALVKYLDNVSNQAIVEFNIPLVGELDQVLEPIKSHDLGDHDSESQKCRFIA